MKRQTKLLLAAGLILILGLGGGTILYAGQRYFMVSHAGAADPFWKIEFKGAYDAAREFGVPLRILAPETPNDITRQLELLQSALKARPAGIAVTLSDAGVFSRALQRARILGIPVVAFNARPLDGDRVKNPYLAYIGTDDYAAGKLAGRCALKSGQLGNFAVVLNHQPGHVGLEARTKGIMDVLTPMGVKVVKLDTTNNERTIKKVFEKFYQTHKDLTAVFCLGPSVLHPIGQFIESKKHPLYIGSFDLSHRTLNYIRSGFVGFTIDQQPYLQGFMSIKMLVLANQHKLVPSNLDTGLGVVNRHNVEQIEALSLEYRRWK